MQKLKTLHVAVILLAGMLIGGIAVSQLGWLPSGHAGFREPEVTVSTPLPAYDEAIVQELNQAFIAIAEKANRSVVTILTNKVVEARRVHPFFDGPFEDFFGEDFFGRFFGPRNRDREYQVRGLGSGVVVSRDGYLLTNNHVIEGADKLQVLLRDGERRDAKVVGTDAKTDIALLKVEGEDLVPLEFGDSEKLRVGEWVMAIGSPLSENLAHTVTTGIVSAKGRSNLRLAEYEDFIQTDAAINPGNSGGALINLKGELVGINTAIASRSGGFQGIGFAVPINMARGVMDALLEHGRVVRGWLGVYIQDMDEAMAEALELSSTRGAVVSDVIDDSPAERAGVKVGDVILKVDDQAIQNSTDLKNKIASYAPETEVQLAINRDGRERTLRVRLGELPEEVAAPQARSRLAENLGFSVQTLTDQLATRYGLDANEEGVIVTDIDGRSNAYRAGLRRGDLIMQVNRKPVRSVRDFNEILSGLNAGDTVLLYAKRESNNFFVAFEID